MGFYDIYSVFKFLKKMDFINVFPKILVFQNFGAKNSKF